MSLYAIGTEAGPVWIGKGRTPERELATLLVKHRPQQLQLLGHWPFTNMGERDLAYQAATMTLAREQIIQTTEGWWGPPAELVVKAIDDAVEIIRQGVGDVGSPAALIGHIRNVIFNVSQSVFARIAGVSSSQVSRWESGAIEPSWSDLARLRAFARRFGFALTDVMLFKVDVAPPSLRDAIKLVGDNERKSNGKIGHRKSSASSKAPATRGSKVSRGKAKRQ